MCLKSLANGGRTGHVKEGHLAGLNLHSRTSCSSMLGKRKGHPDTLKRHLVRPKLEMESKRSSEIDNSSSSLIFSNLVELCFSSSLNWEAMSIQIEMTWVLFIFFNCFSNYEGVKRCIELLPTNEIVLFLTLGSLDTKMEFSISTSVLSCSEKYTLLNIKLYFEDLLINQFEFLRQK